MNRYKLLTVLGLVAAIFGALDAAQVVSWLGPRFGAGLLALGAVAAGAGQALKANPPRGLVTIGAVLTSCVGALAALDLVPLLGPRAGMVLGLLGAIGAAFSKGWHPDPANDTKGGSGLVPVLLLGLLLLPTASCSPADAGALVKPGELRGVAAGDSVTATFYYRTTGNPDSVVSLFLMANAPSVRIPRPGTATSAGPAVLLPVPPLVEGDSGLVTVQWTAYKRNAAPVTGQVSRYFKRPVTPPNVLPDSLRLSAVHIMSDPKLMLGTPAGTYVAPNGTARFCLALTFADGKIGLRSMERADTVCARYYATSVGQLQRVQTVTFATTSSAWSVAPASPARQAALDAVCLQGSDGSADTSAACRAIGAGLRLGQAPGYGRTTS